jgi:hypothetical protein
MAYGKNTWKINVRISKSVMMTDNGQFTVLRYKCVQYKFYTTTEIMMVITNLKKKRNKKSAQNGTHLLKLKM